MVPVLKSSYCGAATAVGGGTIALPSRRTAQTPTDRISTLSGRISNLAVAVKNVTQSSAMPTVHE